MMLQRCSCHKWRVWEVLFPIVVGIQLLGDCEYGIGICDVVFSTAKFQPTCIYYPQYVLILPHAFSQEQT